MKKSTIHNIQEVTIFATIVVAITMAGAFHKFLKGNVISWQDFTINLPTFLIMVLVGGIVYGAMFTRAYKEEITKEPFIKRMGNALIHGFMWRMMLGD